MYSGSDWGMMLIHEEIYHRLGRDDWRSLDKVVVEDPDDIGIEQRWSRTGGHCNLVNVLVPWLYSETTDVRTRGPYSETHLQHWEWRNDMDEDGSGMSTLECGGYNKKTCRSKP